MLLASSGRRMAPLLRSSSSTRCTSRHTASTRALSAALKPWKTSCVESHGNYKDEAWLEDHIQGPLYQHQKSLPRLPVPSLSDTLERFLPTALPLARTQQEAISLQKAVKDFPQQASHLQDRLLQRRGNAESTSWLQHWWNTAGYLQVRDPVVINVSYYFHLADTPLTGPDPQLQRAAQLLQATADYRWKVCTGQLPTDTVGKTKTPLCSVAYKYMFHACRIPASPQDSYRIYDPSLYQHAIIACRGRFFAMDFANAETGEPYSAQVLQQGLREIRDRAEQRESQLDLGWLTSQNRDEWAKAREALLQGNPAMREALDVLQSGCIVICLDEAEELSSREKLAQQFLHAGAEGSSGANRWFDKSIQLVVTRSGKAGLVGEHSMMDGMPVVGYADRLTKPASENDIVDSTVTRCSVQDIFEESFESMTPNQVSQIDHLVQKAKQDLVALASRHEITVQSFQGYGSDFIKKAGFSPDAYVQMAMQLATYRLWGEQGGTYEASQVRPFLHGRTETTRTVSTQSAAFCNKMGLRPKMDEHVEHIRKTKLRLLKEGTEAHVQYIKLAGKAQGVDRHFLGLSMLVEEGEKAPDLYSHPVFQRSKRWRVSTSHLTHPRFENWGYGEVVPDGVGLSYSIHKRHCVFGITCLKEHGWSSNLAGLLEEALLEMRTMVEMDQTPASKL